VANMRQVIYKDLFEKAMESVREKAFKNGAWVGGTRKRARTLARKIARENLREELHQ